MLYIWVPYNHLLFCITPRILQALVTNQGLSPYTEKGQPVLLTDYSNKVVLIVNTASKCGFTPQYAGLETLYQKLKAQYGDDVEFLGFPCNQFGNQEPGSDDEIQSFCQINYGVSFPIVSTIAPFLRVQLFEVLIIPVMLCWYFWELHRLQVV